MEHRPKIDEFEQLTFFEHAILGQRIGTDW